MGIEPMTSALQVQCSTTKLKEQKTGNSYSLLHNIICVWSLNIFVHKLINEKLRLCTSYEMGKDDWDALLVPTSAPSVSPEGLSFN